MLSDHEAAAWERIHPLLVAARMRFGPVGAEAIAFFLGGMPPGTEMAIANVGGDDAVWLLPAAKVAMEARSMGRAHDG